MVSNTHTHRTARQPRKNVYDKDLLLGLLTTSDCFLAVNLFTEPPRADIVLHLQALKGLNYYLFPGIRYLDPILGYQIQTVAEPEL